MAFVTVAARAASRYVTAAPTCRIGQTAFAAPTLVTRSYPTLRRSPVRARRTFSTMVAEGDKAPDFSATDTDGNAVSLAGLKGSPVILFFMAGAGAGCTTQSCAFRDASAQFNEMDAKIIAVSARSDGASFKSNNSLNFPVVNDASGELQRLYGVSKTLGLIPGRYTYIIDREGVVQKIFNSQFSFSEHVRISKETVAAIAK